MTFRVKTNKHSVFPSKIASFKSVCYFEWRIVILISIQIKLSQLTITLLYDSATYRNLTFW